MGFYYPSHDVQAKARTGPAIPSAPAGEGIEHTGVLNWWDAGTRVRHRDRHRAFPRGHPDGDRASVGGVGQSIPDEIAYGYAHRPTIHRDHETLTARDPYTGPVHRNPQGLHGVFQDPPDVRRFKLELPDSRCPLQEST